MIDWNSACYVTLSLRQYPENYSLSNLKMGSAYATDTRNRDPKNWGLLMHNKGENLKSTFVSVLSHINKLFIIVSRSPSNDNDSTRSTHHGTVDHLMYNPVPRENCPTHFMSGSTGYLKRRYAVVQYCQRHFDERWKCTSESEGS